MKTRFNTYDIVCSVTELQRLIGMRVANVYDIDNKTYLIKLQRTEEKAVLLFESGNRIHSTAFEWPKSIAPSGFSMKLRKHLKNKRLESLKQLGSDRIIDLQFGSSEAAYHVILELYDRGNIVLTDYEMTILNVLRPHTEGDKIRFAVREKYPQDRARRKGFITEQELRTILESAKVGDNLKKILVPNLEYGPPLIEHVLSKYEMNSKKIGKTFNIDTDIEKLVVALQEAENIMELARTQPSKGYIVQKKEERPTKDAKGTEYFFSNQEFHPFLFAQHANAPHKPFESFDAAVDEFYSSLESQKIDLKAVQQEREALKKLDNVRKDHDQRLVALGKTQEVDKQIAELITRNHELVDTAIMAVQAALAKQTSWEDLAVLVKEAAASGDLAAKCINQLKLQTNHISLRLSDPYESEDDDDDDDDDDDEENKGRSDNKIPTMVIDVDLALTAFANARRYHDQKRNAAKKQQKTIESQSKALKSAEKKTKQTLKEVQAITSINKARKVYWFEKFFWFISSENYLVIAGRDQQQNELIVKRYMKSNDVYVHADIHGASSVIIKNPTGQPVPPKTLNEAGTMAISYSVAWEAKVVTNAFWVLGEQVSKTAPTGEYLTTGSFMIRGKKHFLPPSHLIMGFSFLFRLEEGSVERHKGERQMHAGVEDIAIPEEDNDVELEVIDESDEETVEKSENVSHEKKNAPENGADVNSDEDTAFPDTQIKIKHEQGNALNIVVEVTNQTKEDDDRSSDSEQVVFLGDDKPVVVRSVSHRSRGPSESKSTTKASSAANETDDQKSTTQNVESSNNKQQQQQQAKRGQKSKLKKIKEKYKDQDDEERTLRMQILQSAGTAKETKKTKKNKSGVKVTKSLLAPNIQKPQQQKPAVGVDGDAADAGDDDEDPGVAAEVDMLDALTGIPDTQDELLFAIPVVAPYNTLLNYKYKVKLTPGTGRRGKAARTAVSMFLKDRTTTQREKDLLRSVKDELLARNLPGKVKLSAPKMQTLRR